MIRFPPPLAMEAIMAGKEISVKTDYLRRRAVGLRLDGPIDGEACDSG